MFLFYIMQIVHSHKSYILYLVRLYTMIYVHSFTNLLSVLYIIHIISQFY